MKTRMTAIAALAAAGLLWGWGSARAQMMGGMMGQGRGMMAGHMGEMMGPGMAGACWADLDDLGLPPRTVKSLEEQRFEMKKKTIRAAADLEILRLELERMLENRVFDLKAAQEKAAEIGQKQTEIRSAHLEFLHNLGAVLSDEQWQKLSERHRGMMHRKMMSGMEGMRGMRGMGGGPGMRMRCMEGGMMQGQQGAPGMMMEQEESGGAEHSAHHPGTSDDAKKSGSSGN